VLIWSRDGTLAPESVYLDLSAVGRPSLASLSTGREELGGSMEKRGFGLLLTTVTVAWVTVGTLFVRPVFAYPTCVGGFIVRAAGYSYASCADAEGQCTSVALDVAQQHCAPCSTCNESWTIYPCVQNPSGQFEVDCDLDYGCLEDGFGCAP